jgi:hypothetical protein
LGSVGLFAGIEAHRRFVGGLLRWIENRLESFVPPAAAEHDSKDSKARTLNKAFLELGLGLAQASRCPQLGFSADVKRMSDWWVGLASARPGLFQPWGRDWLFANAVVGLGLWNMMARAPQALVGDLQVMLDRGYLDCDEDTPWSRLELVCYLDRLGLRHSIGRREALLATSVVAQLPNPCFVPKMSAYKITHILFFLSDFGTRRIDPEAAVDRASLIPYLELLLSTLLAEQDWDLVSEVLMCRLAFGCGRAPLDVEAVRRLCAAQTALGNIPNNGWERKHDPSWQKDDADEVEFGKVYHHTLVALLFACANQSC